MDFVNGCRQVAGWTMGFERDGRELIVVAIKGTYAWEQDGGELQLAQEQVPLVEADQFSGDPGYSAPVYESDYAHRKPMCDVLLNGSAYAPGGRPATQVDVGLRVGMLSKVLRVRGARHWHSSLLGTHTGNAKPFVSQPISYDFAYGGFDQRRDDPRSIKTYLANPVGLGYRPYQEDLDGKPMAHTEEIGQPTDDPDGRYRPMSLGSTGRNWMPRVQHAGTYDQAWLDERAPFWPDDFDHRHFQSAPPDQWLPYPNGGEDILLRNLTPSGRLHLSLPALAMPVLVIPYRGRDLELVARVDTILVEPDLQRVLLTWRATYNPPRSCFDVMRIVAGQSARQWRGPRRTAGKQHYAGLGELVRSRRRPGGS
jgi:hypothetical protein